MKALAFDEHGGLDKLTYRDVPEPKIGDGDVLVKVRACALNHLDLFVREGLPGLKLPLPFWSGCDIAGEVAAVGGAAQGVAVGDRVAVNPNLHCGRCEYCEKGEHSLCVSYGILGEHTYGGLAEYVKVDAQKVVKLPPDVAYEDAAAFVLVNMTAWRMLVTQARLRAGEDLLVIGVGGGVSSTAVQIGKLCGARVWVTSSSDDKLARARELGADECINHAKEDWARVIAQKTGRRGVDVVLENVGAATWQGSIRALAKGGRLVTCGGDVRPHLRDRRAPGVLEADLDHRIDDGEQLGVQRRDGPALPRPAPRDRGLGDAARRRRRRAAAARRGQAVREDRPHALTRRIVRAARAGALSTSGGRRGAPARACRPR